MALRPAPFVILPTAQPRWSAQLPTSPSYPHAGEATYVAALKKADVDALVAGLENEIDQLQDRLDHFNHAHKVEVDGRTLDGKSVRCGGSATACPAPTSGR